MRLQKYPPGLLARFALKTTGQAPDNFGETVLPTTDVTAEYGLDLTVVQSVGPSNLANLGDELTLAVPTGQIWDVIAASFWLACPGTTSVLPMGEINARGVAMAFSGVTDDLVRANPFEVVTVWAPSQRVLLSPDQTIKGIVRSTPNSTIAALLRALVRVYEQ